MRGARGPIFSRQKASSASMPCRSIASAWSNGTPAGLGTTSRDRSVELSLPPINSAADILGVHEQLDLPVLGDG